MRGADTGNSEIVPKSPAPMLMCYVRSSEPNASPVRTYGDSVKPLAYPMPFRQL
jgi:hypothetical protein